MKKRTELALLVAVTFLITLLSPMGQIVTGSSAKTVTTGTVTATALYVRSGPGTSYSILTVNGSYVKLSKGTKVTVLATSGNWYKISLTYSGTAVTGYSCATYIKTTTVTTTPTPTAAAVSSNKIATVTASALNMRKGPGTVYNKVITLSKGVKITVLGTAKDSSGTVWYKGTATVSGKTYTGYVISSYVKVTTVTATPTPTKKATATPTPTKKATATPTPTKKATATPTPTKKATATPTPTTKPTSTPTTKPTATSTPKPTSTPTPKPTATATPKPTSTPTSKPTSTPTPKPTATATPKPTATSTPKPTATPTPTAKATGTYPISGTVNVTILNMRSGAGTEFSKIATFSKGQAVSVTGYTYDSDGDIWYETSITSGGVTYKGYMFGSYITLSAELPVKLESGTVPSSITDYPYYYAAYMNGSSVNLRTGAGTSNASIAKLSDHQAVYVYGESWVGDIIWYHLVTEVDGVLTTGYSSGTYVVLDYSTTGYWAKANAAISVFKTPGASANVVTNSNGTAVTIAKNAYVYITNEQMVSSVKYDRVAFSAGGTVYYGYVKASSLTLTKSGDTGSFNPYEKDSDFETAMRKAGFPESYLPYLVKLHEEHPNWNFEPFLTGLDFDDALDAEGVVGENLISSAQDLKWLSFESGAYNWGTDTFVPYDGKTWVTVSKQGLAYFMDPRNWLTESYIFMFEELTYDSSTQTKAGVECILKGTPMYKTTFTYTDDSGNTKTMYYSDAFIDAAKYSGVNPYHLASRVKQEVIASSTSFSLSATGTVEGYEGLYNFYNIGASNSTANMGAIKNGLKFAKYGGTNSTLNAASKIPWDNIYDAIVGGAYYIGYNYIARGQNSIYLQKFNVTGRSTYNHQYMANVRAPRSEGYKVSLAYTAMDDYDTMAITFSIPVYNNMPETAVSEPATVYNPNNYLKTLTVTDSNGNAVTLSPAFSYSTMDYTGTLSSTATSVTVSATAVASSATVGGATGNVKVSSGTNKIIVTVTAANGTVRNYKITLTK